MPDRDGIGGRQSERPDGARAESMPEGMIDGYKKSEGFSIAASRTLLDWLSETGTMSRESETHSQ